MPKVTMGHRMELIRFYFQGYPCQVIPEKSSVAKGSVVNVTEIKLFGAAWSAVRPDAGAGGAREEAEVELPF